MKQRQGETETRWKKTYLSELLGGLPVQVHYLRDELDVGRSLEVPLLDLNGSDEIDGVFDETCLGGVCVATFYVVVGGEDCLGGGGDEGAGDAGEIERGGGILLELEADGLSFFELELVEVGEVGGEDDGADVGRELRGGDREDLTDKT